MTPKRFPPIASTTRGGGKKKTQSATCCFQRVWEKREEEKKVWFRIEHPFFIGKGGVYHPNPPDYYLGGRKGGVEGGMSLPRLTTDLLQEKKKKKKIRDRQLLGLQNTRGGKKKRKEKGGAWPHLRLNPGGVEGGKKEEVGPNSRPVNFQGEKKKKKERTSCSNS